MGLLRPHHAITMSKKRDFFKQAAAAAARKTSRWETLWTSGAWRPSSRTTSCALRRK